MRRVKKKNEFDARVITSKKALVEAQIQLDNLVVENKLTIESNVQNSKEANQRSQNFLKHEEDLRKAENEVEIRFAVYRKETELRTKYRIPENVKIGPYPH